jgi:hypothetical protein
MQDYPVRRESLGADNMTPEIEEFAQRLVRWVRDAAIQNGDMILRPDVNAPTAKRWRLAAREGSSNVFASVNTGCRRRYDILLASSHRRGTA